MELLSRIAVWTFFLPYRILRLILPGATGCCRPFSMKSVLRKTSLPALLEKLHPVARTREVVLQEPEDGSSPLRTYMATVRKAHRDDCIILPPGEYPAPPTTKPLMLRALRPGTVVLKGTARQPALVVDSDVCLWFSGILLLPGEDGDLAIQQSRGCVILSNCQISGGIEVEGREASLYCDSCLLDHADTGLSVTNGARSEICSTVVAGCHVGLFAGHNSTLDILHSRIEGSSGSNPEAPGAGLHGEGATICCTGSLFVDNQLGAHLDACKEVRFLFSRFERQLLGGFMMRQGGTLHMHECLFREQAATDYAHLTLEGVTAALDYCDMDASAGSDVDFQGGSVTRQNDSPKTSPAKDEIFSLALAEIHKVIGMSDSKAIMENILHQAHAAIQRKERGLPVPPQRFHCIFEGPEGSGRSHAAGLLSRALHALGLLNGNGNVVEGRMESLLLGSTTVSDMVESASGGILMLHAPDQQDRRDAKLSFSRTRENLQQVIEACGADTILIFTGPRDSVRPVVCNSPEMEEMFRTTIQFSHPSPPEIAEMFAALAASQNIGLTTKARMKILLALHMMHDRRDRRFLNSGGVAKLLDAAQKRYYERCSRERNFELRMDAGDIDVPVEKLADTLLQTQPAFVSICPHCKSENPWVPGLEKIIRCANCGQGWHAGWGIWTGSLFYRMKTSDAEEVLPAGLLPRRKRAGLPA